MKQTINLIAEKRDTFGTSSSRNARLKQKIPAIIYGEKKDNENIFLNEYALTKAFKYEYIYSTLLDISISGNKQTVIIKSIQRHQYKNKILHIDFQRVTDDSIISTKIPINFLNTKNCVGVKYGGKINIKMVDINIICKAKNLPEYLDIDLSTLKLEENLCLSDLKQNSNITFSDEKKGFNRIVVAVKKPKKLAEKTEDKNEGSKTVEAESAENKNTNEKDKK
jgi:large subunit ribosomal protein L25